MCGNLQRGNDRMREVICGRIGWESQWVLATGPARRCGILSGGKIKWVGPLGAVPNLNEQGPISYPYSDASTLI
jgi:hypothetical protein